ncbi:recombinase family protein [Acetobacterium carbinolicum]|uniref:recombinase family protein n=1 Tax=Acetobacterium carbinolicum TaxID=52690 RepID=UPI003BF6123B
MLVNEVKRKKNHKSILFSVITQFSVIRYTLNCIKIYVLRQEESRSISENVTWGKRKSFADGKISLPYKKFLGYEKGEDELPKIIEEQAKTVRLIYKLFLEGKTPSAIGRYLMNEKIPTPGGKVKWSVSTILSIWNCQ